MRAGQLYRGHANATALCRSPVISALGSKSDDPGSGPGRGKALCPWDVRAPLLGLAKSIYYHHQNMDPMYPSSKGREPVGEVKIKLCASLASQRIHFINQWQVLKDPRDHARDRKQRRLHLALIFDCAFHRLLARELSYFFSQLFCLIQHL